MRTIKQKEIQNDGELSVSGPRNNNKHGDGQFLATSWRPDQTECRMTETSIKLARGACVRALFCVFTVRCVYFVYVCDCACVRTCIQRTIRGYNIVFHHNNNIRVSRLLVHSAAVIAPQTRAGPWKCCVQITMNEWNWRRRRRPVLIYSRKKNFRFCSTYIILYYYNVHIRYAHTDPARSAKKEIIIIIVIFFFSYITDYQKKKIFFFCKSF